MCTVKLWLSVDNLPCDTLVEQGKHCFGPYSDALGWVPFL